MNAIANQAATAEEARRDNEQAKNQRECIALFVAIVTMLFLIGYTIINAKQLQVSRTTYIEAKRQADAAWEAMRPYLFVSLSDDEDRTTTGWQGWTREVGDSIEIQFTVSNDGKGPAILSDAVCHPVWIEKSGLTRKSFDSVVSDGIVKVPAERFISKAVVAGDHNASPIRCTPPWPINDKQFKDALATSNSVLCQNMVGVSEARKIAECLTDLWIMAQVTYTDTANKPHKTTVCSEFDGWRWSAEGDTAYCNRQE